ncbi:MAG: VanW family protein [Armatimonadetes bacterium]|nr:VanW family protein [Armatimonadota bacterium]
MKSKKGGKAAKVVLFTVLTVIVAAAGTVSALAARYEARFAPGTMIGNVDLGGATKQEAEQELQAWWSEVAQRPINLTAPSLERAPEGLTSDSLGLRLDLNATLKQVRQEDFWSKSAREITGKAAPAPKAEPVVFVGGEAAKELSGFVAQHQKDFAPARVDLVDGQIVRTPEQTGVDLDEKALTNALTKAVLTGQEQELPLVKANAKVPDSELEKIKEVVSSFTSHFSEGNANRASNIKNAAKRLSGTILMPGETFSFNKTLGRRTAENGFKLAGVYNNGKHDFDIGGGICQVSGTLYNAVLLANLKIANRSNHTFPVPYLPVGRDATVSYPAPDFAFKNDTDTPVAISAKAAGGSITFTILGLKEAGVTVKITTAGHTSWGRGIKVVNDPSLPPGRRVVEEPGGSGHRIMTYRSVYKDGVEVKRESLGESVYPGGVRVVRQNTAAPKSATKPVEVPGKPIDNESPDTVPPLSNSGGG